MSEVVKAISVIRRAAKEICIDFAAGDSELELEDQMRNLERKCKGFLEMREAARRNG